MKVSELFDICYGMRNFYFKNQIPGNIPYISSQSKNQGIMGYVKSDKTYSNIITVARNGSVGTSFYHDYDCIPNDDCLILTAKQALTKRQYVYYCLVIQSQKSLFTYGRKVTPERLGELDIPAVENIPAWVETIEIPDFQDLSEAKKQQSITLPDISEWKDFSYTALFDIKKVTGPKVSEVKKMPGNIPYVSATSENNGIAAYGDFEPTMKGNCITVGHLGDCFYQAEDFAGSNVTALIPKFELNKTRAMFLLPLLNASKFKYCYGRVIGISRLEEENIALPVADSGKPDWELMENYINSLPYSKYL